MHIPTMCNGRRSLTRRISTAVAFIYAAALALVLFAAPAGAASPTVRRCKERSVVVYEVFPDNLDATLMSAQAAIARSQTAVIAAPQRSNCGPSRRHGRDGVAGVRALVAR